MKMMKNELDPIRESIESQWKVTIYLKNGIIRDAVLVAATKKYIAFETDDSATKWLAVPWRDVIGIGNVEPFPFADDRPY